MKDRLIKIINELKAYEGVDKKSLYIKLVEERLNDSLKNYYNELTQTLNNLYTYNEDHSIQLMKKLNKEN